ncbi:excalibur calcium-binding domain-containing protein [Gordonia sp. CPCC 205515]
MTKFARALVTGAGAVVVMSGGAVAVQAAPLPFTPTPVAYYENCTAARAAGVTPIYRGQDGYAAHLDRDHDGIACE